MTEESGFKTDKFVYSYPINFNRYIVNLDSNIVAPEEYRELTDILIRADDSESIIFNINSSGGRLDSTRQIISLMLNTEAHTKAIIFQACSAASLIALAADSIEVSPLGSMMIHTSYFGTEGKTPDMVGQSKHIDQMTHQLFELVYSGFLNEQEMREMFMGKEFYFDAKQIEKRLKKFVPIRRRDKK